MSYRSTLIKSIQRGTITLTSVTTNTATITAVVLANTVIRFLGFDFQTDSGVTAAQVRTYVELTNTTTVTASRNTGTGTVRLNYEVIEYYPGLIKSVQRGILAMTTASNTATITAVDTTKAECAFLGVLANDGNAGEFAGRSASKIELTNSTTVTASRGIGTNSANVSYQVVEYF